MVVLRLCVLHLRYGMVQYTRRHSRWTLTKMQHFCTNTYRYMVIRSILCKYDCGNVSSERPAICKNAVQIESKRNKVKVVVVLLILSRDWLIWTLHSSTALLHILHGRRIYSMIYTVKACPFPNFHQHTVHVEPSAWSFF